ncbi:MAG: polyprenyl synthetase family protein [Cytophagales bacterium]|nr:polyprenyl synthetase family protein [Cytophagales bacterium]
MKLLETEIRKSKFGSSPRSLYDPIHYMMSLGGKRTRPLLTILSYTLYRDDAEKIIPYAAAVEAFHNFTLIHDDIMDQAPLRRGKVTVHQKWDVNTAILAGDVLMVKVYERFLSLEEKKLKEVLTLFNACASAVCEGQQWDMEFESSRKVSVNQYIRMIELKTAVLLGFSLELGAVLGDAPEKDKKILRDFGINLGIAFQLQDDLLDVYGDRKKFGKRPGGDIISNKKTFLLIHAMNRAKGAKGKELKRWLSAKKFDKTKKVKAVAALYDALGVRELTEKAVNRYKSKASKCLDQLSVPLRANGLRQFVQDLAIRQK